MALSFFGDISLERTPETCVRKSVTRSGTWTKVSSKMFPSQSTAEARAKADLEPEEPTPTISQSMAMYFSFSEEGTASLMADCLAVCSWSFFCVACWDRMSLIRGKDFLGFFVLDSVSSLDGSSD